MSASLISTATTSTMKIHVPKPRRLIPIDLLISTWNQSSCNNEVLRENWWESRDPIPVGGVKPLIVKEDNVPAIKVPYYSAKYRNNNHHGNSTSTLNVNSNSNSNPNRSLHSCSQLSYSL